jgi:peptidoglycan L-alanyl-D-glutamate endopeptidase CwlK
MIRPIDTLDADVRHLADRHLAACLLESIVLRVTDGYRSFAQQAQVYAVGRDEDGNVVDEHAILTKARPGTSWHNWGDLPGHSRAYDVCIVRFPGDLTPQNVYDGPWERVAVIGESFGLTAGAHFHGRFIDRPHFEYPNGRTIAALLAAHPKGLAA